MFNFNIISVWREKLLCMFINQVNGNKISVRLRTPDWQSAIQKELDLYAINTTPLYQPFTNSLLGDDFSIPTMEFDMEDGE